MKRISLLIFTLLSMLSVVTAQTIDDAFRYSQIFYGDPPGLCQWCAFTALGGDISSLSQNRRIGVFRASELTVSPQLFQIKTKAGFNGVATSSNLSDFNLSQIGIVANLISNNNEAGLLPELVIRSIKQITESKYRD